MEAHRFLPHYNYEDYKLWEGRWELIEGIPFAMSPAPRPKHQWITAAIIREFGMALKGCKDCKVYDPLDYMLSEETILQPDVLVVCGEIKEAYLDFPPALVVEVLSPATASKDKVYKLNLYQQEGIPYYLVVDVDKEMITILELVNGHYEPAATTHDATHTFHFAEGCEAVIDFGEVWK